MGPPAPHLPSLTAFPYLRLTDKRLTDIPENNYFSCKFKLPEIILIKLAKYFLNQVSTMPFFFVTPPFKSPSSKEEPGQNANAMTQTSRRNPSNSNNRNKATADIALPFKDFDQS